MLAAIRPKSNLDAKGVRATWIDGLALDECHRPIAIGVSMIRARTG
jgi:hypothetical protein